MKFLFDMKACRDCLEVKEFNHFYKHKHTADGHLNKCKDCVKDRIAKHRSENIDKIRAYDRSRGSRAHLYPDYQKSDAIKESYRKSKARLADKNKHKKNAHALVRNALRRGDLIKPNYCSNCEVSGKGIEGHHTDYNKPLSVVWLCRHCHAQEHKNINNNKRVQNGKQRHEDSIRRNCRISKGLI